MKKEITVQDLRKHMQQLCELWSSGVTPVRLQELLAEVREQESKKLTPEFWLKLAHIKSQTLLVDGHADRMAYEQIINLGHQFGLDRLALMACGIIDIPRRPDPGRLKGSRHE